MGIYDQFKCVYMIGFLKVLQFSSDALDKDSVTDNV